MKRGDREAAMVASAGGYAGRRNIMKMMEEHLLLPMYITILARADRRVDSSLPLALEDFDLNNK